MVARVAASIVLSLMIASAAFGEDEDTVFVPVSHDSSYVPASPEDTLTDAEKARASFERRRELFKEKGEEQFESLSYYDSLLAWFASPRLNQRVQLGQSFFHDAGDYFRFDPSYFVLDQQSTPMRKTVRPFGLSGNRLNLIVGRMSLAPFEHAMEPDGLVDLNDIPTAPNHDVFVLPGPVGQLFGGKQSVATLLTQPKKPESFVPESALLVDKGSFGYNYVRGRYSKRFSAGRNIDLSIGYRSADGITFNRDDDAYHYTGSAYVPTGPGHGVRASGWLYDREGSFAVRPDGNGATLSRSRVDRNARVSFEIRDNDSPARYEAGYEHICQASDIDGAYKGRFAHTGHGLFLVREWVVGSAILKAQVDGRILEYEDGFGSFDRASGGFSLSFARLKPGWRYAVTAGGDNIEGYRWLPFTAAVAFRETQKSFFMLSVGYSERAPSLHEVNLRYQRKSMYGSGSKDYADQGNQDLSTEKQLVGNLLIEIGSLDNSIGVSLTGGSIKGGIDWRSRRLSDTLGEYTLFRPVNGDIDFLDVRVKQKLRIKDFLRLTAGGAYHYLDYAEFEDKAYQPDYQAFSGVEFHIFWPQKLVDLFAYGEVVYVGEYDGYDKVGLGDHLIANAKLSFRIKDFRFHYVFQNVISTAYETTEDSLIPGRYNYYGFVWKFLN